MDILLPANEVALSHFPTPLTSFNILVPFVLLAALIVTVTRRTSKHSGQVSDVHYGWPIVGNAISYSNDPMPYLRKATAQYGKIFKTNMLFTTTIWLRNPHLNKFYLETKEHTWSFGDGMGLFLNKIVSPGYFDQLKTFVASLSRGINRKVALDHYTNVTTETSKGFLSTWSEKEEMDLFEHISELVHAVIVQCLMGPDFYAKNGSELYGLLHGMEADIGNMSNLVLPEWVPHPAAVRLKQRKNRVGEIFQERLNERNADPEEWTDALDYISYTLNDSVTTHLSHLYASHHTLLMFASHTSTVASISWTILELLKSPNRINILRQELSHGSTVQSSQYLQACLKETGRRYSGISMLRLARQPTTPPATEITVPQGSVVSISPYLTHQDPNIYPNADQWNPERWIEEPGLAKRLNSGSQLAYIPFGAGAHRCPGEKLAGLIASTVVGTLVGDYDIAWGNTKADLSKLDFSKIGSPWLKGDATVSIKRRKAQNA
ncbi:MAG: hypothetical protein Q9166_007431 [cf. Caloplaca sp. 2 TL-2023]